MHKTTAPRGSLERKLHGAIEPLFFALRDRLSPPERMLSEVGIEPGWSVLDFGCGIGGHTIAAAELVGEEGKIYAVDIDPSRIERVTALAARRGLANVRAIVTDCDTTLDAESMDAVLLYDVLHDLEQPGRVLKELGRVLRPGGVLSFADHHIRGAEALSRLTAGGVFELGKEGRLTTTFRRRGGHPCL